MVGLSCTLTVGKQQYSLDHIPTLFVATKSDLDLAQQVGPSDSCLAERLCNANLPETRDMRYSQMCTAEDLTSKCQSPLA
jgi:hypothetical protein